MTFNVIYAFCHLPNINGGHFFHFFEVQLLKLDVAIFHNMYSFIDLRCKNTAIVLYVVNNCALTMLQ